MSMSIVLSGCEGIGAVSETPLNTVEYTGVSWNGEADYSYEVPRLLPGILTDRLGYEPQSAKMVIFRRTGEERTFTIRDEKTRQIVYTGIIRFKNNRYVGSEYLSYGDFSDLTQAGSYYVQMDTYGESYPFIIHDNLYYSMFKRTFEKLNTLRTSSDTEDMENTDNGWQMQEKGKKKEIAACRSVYLLLTSYELFPEVYSDDMGIKESGNGIADILDECRYETKWLLHQTQASPDGDGETCAYQAAVLAKYAYLTRELDGDFSAKCQKAAQAAWKGMAQDGETPEDMLALAAAELYRATGNVTYAAAAEEHLKACLTKGKLTEAEFFCGVAYMNTKSKVEVALCEAVIKKIMEEAETIAARSKNSRFLICSERENESADVLLGEMLRICIVNHIITNHEYNTVIENHFHYLMGRNPDAIRYASCFEGEKLEQADMLEDVQSNAAFMFLLSELLSN